MSKNKIIIYCYSISLNGTLVIMNYELTLGVPAIAVGLSALSLLALPAPKSRPRTQLPAPRKKARKGCHSNP